MGQSVSQLGVNLDEVVYKSEGVYIFKCKSLFLLENLGGSRWISVDLAHDLALANDN